MYFYRMKKYIGSYAAALGGVDIIVFTGGVGENQASARWASCEGLEFMGIKLDAERNKVRGEEAIISTDDSKVKVVVIPTDEVGYHEHPATVSFLMNKSRCKCVEGLCLSRQPETSGPGLAQSLFLCPAVLLAEGFSYIGTRGCLHRN